MTCRLVRPRQVCGDRVAGDGEAAAMAVCASCRLPVNDATGDGAGQK
jgi:hypothetical protein